MQLPDHWDHFSNLRHGHSHNHLGSHLTHHHPHHGHHPHALSHTNYSSQGLSVASGLLYSSPPVSSSSSSGAGTSLTPLQTSPLSSSSSGGIHGGGHNGTTHNPNNGSLNSSGALLSGGSIHSGASALDPSSSPTPISIGHSPNPTGASTTSGLLSSMKLEGCGSNTISSSVSNSAETLSFNGYTAAAVAAAAAAHHSTTTHHHHAGHGMPVVPGDFSSAAAVVQNATGLTYMHEPHFHTSHYQQYLPPGGFENWTGFHSNYL